MAGHVQAINITSEVPLRSHTDWPVGPTGMALREDRYKGRHVVSKGQLAGCAEDVLGHGLGCPRMGRLIGTAMGKFP